MNARTNTYEISCEGHQISEVVSSLFQSILFYRSYGKFQYKQEGTYSMGTLGYEEIVCDFVDFTYVRCASPSLVESVNKEIKAFVDLLRENQNQSGTISLEFFLRRKGRWSFYDNPLVWEIWTLKMDCATSSSRNRLEESLLEKLLAIIQAINASKCYLPQMPSEDLAGTVFDTSYDDVQPYMHRIRYKVGTQTGQPQSPAHLKEFLKGALQL